MSFLPVEQSPDLPAPPLRDSLTRLPLVAPASSFSPAESARASDIGLSKTRRRTRPRWELGGLGGKSRSFRHHSPRPGTFAVITFFWVLRVRSRGFGAQSGVANDYATRTKTLQLFGTGRFDDGDCYEILKRTERKNKYPANNPILNAMYIKIRY